MEVSNIGVTIIKHPFKHFNQEEFSIRRDDVFKIIFGSTSNIKYLKSFLEAILHINITDIKVKPEFSLDQIHVKDKLIKLDILAEINKKELVNIEVQNKKIYNIIKRGQAHASKLYYNSLEKGSDYDIGKKTIIVWLLDNDIFPDGPYHEVSEMVRSSNKEIISDDITYHYIQLEKFYNQIEEISTPEEQWLAYLSCQLNKKELEGVFAMNKEIRDVNELAKQVLNDKELLDAINDTIMDRNLKNLIRAYARDEGIAEGMAKGIKKGKAEGEKEKAKEIAKNLLKSGMDIDTIAEVTKLTKEEIEKL